jgi:hypothetical protein
MATMAAWRLGVLMWGAVFDLANLKNQFETQRCGG